MGGGSIPKIPDWRTYTVGEHTPELLKTQRMLKSLGLNVSFMHGHRDTIIPRKAKTYLDVDSYIFREFFMRSFWQIPV